VYDGQTWVDQCNVQVNGVVMPDPGCPGVVRIHWDWGDGQDYDHWFPAPHTYAFNGTYNVTVTPYDSEGGSTSQTIEVTVGDCVPPDLNDGLVAHYPFNGGASDESGNGNDGTVYGAAIAADRFGIPGKAYLFDGINDYIQVARSSSLDITGRLTMAAWVYAHTVPWGVTAVVEKEISSMGYNIHLLSPNAIHVRVDGGVVEGGLIETNQWHFLAGVHDGTDLIMYIDGIEIARTAESLPTRVPDKDLFIGSWQMSRFFDGLIDDVRIYDRALAPSEITQLYNLPPENSPPVANDEGPYDLAEDSTQVVVPPGVLGNDSDPDGDVLSAVLDTPPAHGVVNLSPDGWFTYSPDPDYFGPDSFRYRASDGELLSEPATVFFSVYNVNDAPVLAPVPDQTVEEHQILELWLAATDVDGDILTYSASGPPGASIDSATGFFRYIPEYDVSTANEDTFFDVVFVAEDGSGGSSSRGAQITIIDVNGGTPPGDHVVVDPVDPVTGTSPVSLTFDQVVEGGETSVTTTTGGPPPETGFKLGNNTYVEIETDAVYEPPISLCFDYSGYGVTGHRETKLRLYHLVPQDGFMEDGTQCTRPIGCWDDITDPDDPPDNPNPDTENDIICGTSNSLSLFAVFEAIEITAPLDPVEVGIAVVASLDFGDAVVADEAVWAWGDGSQDSMPVTTGLIEASHAYTEAGIYIPQVTLRDAGLDVGSAEYKYVVVYDPEGGFVTGGGWIDSPEGAYPADPTLTGKANFGFVSKYQHGAAVPSGNTQFRFRAADLGFHSTAYQWLVVAGPQAKFKGDGEINGVGDYGFMLSARDGQRPGGGGSDKFRIKIWDKATDAVIYDNQIEDDDDAPPTTVIGGGSIVIHN
jgi:PKD repeat protein